MKSKNIKSKMASAAILELHELHYLGHFWTDFVQSWRAEAELHALRHMHSSTCLHGSARQLLKAICVSKGNCEIGTPMQLRNRWTYNHQHWHVFSRSKSDPSVKFDPHRCTGVGAPEPQSHGKNFFSGSIERAAPWTTEPILMDNGANDALSISEVLFWGSRRHLTSNSGVAA